MVIDFSSVISGLMSNAYPFQLTITDDIVLIVVAVLGGVTRALYGLLKDIEAKKPSSIWYFIQNLVTAGIIGGVAGTVFKTSIMATAMIGYVGTDILENIFNAISPKKIELKREQ